MGAGEGTSSWRLLARVWAPLAVLAGVEVFALGPRLAWSNPRIWLAQLLGISIVALLIWLATLLIERGLRLVGRRTSGLDVALWLLVVVVGCAQAWELAGTRLPVPGKPLQLLTLVGILSIGFVLIRVVGNRLGRDPRGLWLGFAALLAGLILFQAARQNLHWSGGYASAKPALIGLVGVYALLSVLVLLWGSARRALWASALLLLGVLSVRATTTNAFELHATEKADSSAGSGPPVLLIVLDTFRADAVDLSRETGSTTPNLARFASEADVYTHAISNASWTLPGHASIFTGQPLARHRTDFTTVPGFHASLPPELPTAQQIFKAKGYRTSCVAANGVLSPPTGLLRGCQRFCHPSREWFTSTLPLRLGFMVSQSRLARRGISLLLVEMTGLYPNARANEIVDQAIEEIQGEPRPLYVFLNFMDTHPPYPTTDATPFLARLSYRRDLLLMLAGRSSYEGFAEPYADLLRASYREQVEQLDRELGRLFDSLRQRGWYDKMLIVVTADHGHAFWENTEIKSYCDHQGAYEPVVRIPLMVKHPGQHQGAVFHHYVQQVSILPALLKTAGLPPLPGEENGGLEADAARGPIVTEWYPLTRGDSHFLPWTRFGVYKDRYKFVMENQTHESMFDLQQGPYESVNVIDREPQLASELRRELTASLDQAAQKQGTGAQKNPDVEEQLRALGYIN